MDAKREEINILAVGGKDAASTAKALYDGFDISLTTTDSGVPRRGLFDVVVSYHALQKVPYWDTVKEIEEYMVRLKPEGEIIILVPSLEWAAEQILSEDPHPLIKYHLFGSKARGRPNKNGFTMRELRDACERGGIAATHAATGEYTVVYNGEAYSAEELFIRGVHQRRQNDNPVQK
jgi:predicted SAM-dependent methyltransferase